MSTERSKKRVLSSCWRRWAVMSRAMPSDPIGVPVASRNGLFVTDSTRRRSPKRPEISYDDVVSLSSTALSCSAILPAISGSSSSFACPTISRPGRPIRRAVALLMSR